LNINGLIHYQRSFEEISQKTFDSEFLFSGGYVRQSGFGSSSGSFSGFFIALNNNLGHVKSITNLKKIDCYPSLDYFKNELCGSIQSDLRIGVWYNESEKTFFLFRDSFGTIPLFYIHVPGIFFAFSTTIAHILSHKLVKDYLHFDLSKLTSYASWSHPDVNTDASSTFFKQIKSCLPGHLISVNSSAVKSTPNTPFNPHKWAHLKALEDAGSLVRESLKKSVSNFAMGAELVGSHLSGGLDSSSVSSVFKHLYPDKPLHTFHISANNYESDESYYSTLVASDIKSIHHEVNQPLEDLKAIELSTKLYCQPESSYVSPASNHKIISQARSFGCDVLMNGHGGDSVIGNGMELLEQSFVQKNWTLTEDLLRKRTNYTTLSTQYPGWDAFSHKKKYHLVLQNFLYRRIPFFRALPAHEMFRLYNEVSKSLGISYWYFIKRASTNLLLRTFNRGARSESTVLKDDILQSKYFRSEEQNFPMSLRGNLPSQYQEVFEDVFNPHMVRAQENFFMLSNFFGISNRSPLMTAELFEICLAIPDIVKYGDGIGRAHFREAMKNILVEEVRTRGTKSSISSPDGVEMTLRLLSQAQHYIHDVDHVWEYIDRQKFADQVKILKNEKIPGALKTSTFFHITRTVSLSVWLEWWKKSHAPT